MIKSPKISNIENKTKSKHIRIKSPKINKKEKKPKSTEIKIKSPKSKSTKNFKKIIMYTKSNPNKKKDNRINIINITKINKINIKKYDKSSRDLVNKFLLSKKDTIPNKQNSLNNSIDQFKTDASENDKLNEMPFTLALKVDKRNVFQIYFSFIFHKLEFINLFCGNESLKILLVYEYLFNLLINFFFNALLYTDEVVSNKYHNNGQLDFVVSLTLTLLSNIITSIFCYFIKLSETVEERLESIMEIKKMKIHYVKNIIKLMKYTKIRFIFLILEGTIIIGLSFYYIIIFYVLYRKSRTSLLINFIISIVESIIITIGITIIIVIARKIGLICKNRYSYNISKYINSKY